MMPLIVELPQGKLQGKENKSVLNGKPFYSFLGIPYAKPPVGELRFQPPQPSEKWQGVYDATFDRDMCMQKDSPSHSRELKGTENCLFLGLDLPQLPSEVQVPKPVMIFIHGGGFSRGSAEQEFLSSDYLMDHDVIFVRIQYRLHVLGFLNLGLPECPGNVGLKDQTLAIKWVKENISYFGGDPNNITLFGVSSGGSSVNFHLISPLSKGLFNKAIVQCGTVFSPWSLTFDNKGMARKLGEKCGFKGGSDSALLEFLKKQDARDLTIYVAEIYKDIKKKNPAKLVLTNPFSPSVEEIRENAFLPEYPHKLLKTAEQVPLIYGVTQKEGILSCLVNPTRLWDQLNEDFSASLKNNFDIDPSALPEVTAKVKQYYFGDNEIGPETSNQLVDYYSDLYFYHMYDTIKFAAKSKYPPFMYEFKYDSDGGLNYNKHMVPDILKLKKGAYHAEEYCYLLYFPKFNSNPSFTDEDLTMIQNLTKFWTNFAKTGVPADNSIWAPSTLNQPRYLKIDRTLQLVEDKVYGERLQFLRNTLDPVINPKIERNSDEFFPYFSKPQY